MSSGHSVNTGITHNCSENARLVSESAPSTPPIQSERLYITSPVRSAKGSPSIMDVLPTEILQRIINEVRSVSALAHGAHSSA